MTVGLRQLCCRLGMDARSFARGAASLKDAAQVSVGEDLFRQVVEAEGKAVLAAPADGDGQLELDWSASACKATTPDGRRLVCDGADVFAVENGQVARKDTYLDWPALQQQLTPETAIATSA